VFTQLLAPICGSLVAIEVAETAVERARKRLTGFDNVSFIQAALPEQMPDGSFDLIVASDVLVYFPKDVLVDISHMLAARLAPGGVLFSLHYLGYFGQPITGDTVHEILRHHLQLEQVHDESVVGVGPRGAGYTITIFRKPKNSSNMVA
jgi:SAM-dependent methyltransferase